MRTNASRLDAFHRKAPYVEIIITAFFGFFIDRFFNKILDVSVAEKWYLSKPFFILLAGLFIIFLYYRFLSSIRVRRSTKIDQKQEDLLETLLDEGKKELKDDGKTIAQKVEVYELIMKVRRG